MAFKQDYGLRRMREGVSPATDLIFDDFHMFSLDVLGRDAYSTTADTQYEGELHCVSLDLNRALLEQVLTKAPPRLAAFLRAELSRDPASQRAIDFPDDHVILGVRARLGSLQIAAKEEFVPLVAHEIL